MPTLQERFPALGEKITTAQREGYSDDEIFSFVRGRIGEAIKSGYSASEVNDFLGVQSRPSLGQRIATGPAGDVAAGVLDVLRQLGGSPELPGLAFEESARATRELLPGKTGKIAAPVAGSLAAVAAGPSVFLPRAFTETLSQAIEPVSRGLGETTFKKTGSPLAATVAGLTPDILFLFGPAAFLKLKGRPPASRAELVRAAREEPRFIEELKGEQIRTEINQALSKTERPTDIIELTEVVGEAVSTPERVKIVKPIRERVATADQSLASFLENSGGISLAKSAEAGELRALRESARGKRFVKAKTGMTLDEAALRAAEAGFIEEPSASALLRALNDEIEGRPVLSLKGAQAEQAKQLEQLGGPLVYRGKVFDKAKVKKSGEVELTDGESVTLSKPEQVLSVESALTEPQRATIAEIKRRAAAGETKPLMPDRVVRNENGQVRVEYTDLNTNKRGAIVVFEGGEIEHGPRISTREKLTVLEELRPTKAPAARVNPADVPTVRSATLKHFTTPEGKAALESGKPFDFAQLPEHGTGDLGAGPKTGRFAGPERIYLSLDDAAWSKVLKEKSGGQIVEATDANMTRGVPFYDYDKQKWMIKIGGHEEVPLVPVEFRVDPNARILRIASLDDLRRAVREAGEIAGEKVYPLDDPKFWDALARRYDVIELRNVKETAGKTDHKFFKAAKADQAIVLNPEVAEAVKPTTPKVQKPLRSATARQPKEVRPTEERINSVDDVQVGQPVYDALIDRTGEVTKKFKDSVQLKAGGRRWVAGVGNRLRKVEIISPTEQAKPVIEQTPAGAQAVIPGAEAREIPRGGLKPKTAQTEEPLPLEVAQEARKQRSLFGDELPQGEVIDPNIENVGMGIIPPTRGSILRGMMLKAQAKGANGQAATKAPKVIFQEKPGDIGWLSLFGSPSNVLKRYGGKVRQAIQDLNLTEIKTRIDFGRRMEADLEHLRSIPKREFGERGEVFWDVFEGKPLNDILARPDLSAETKRAATHFRNRFDADRRFIIQSLRDEIKPAVTERVERQLRDNRAFIDEGQTRRTPEQTAQLKGAVEAIAKTEIEQQIPDSWGIRDYLPHIIPGDFRIFVHSEEGRAFIGAARTRLEALKKIAEHSASNPALSPDAYSVRHKTFMHPDLVRVSSPKRWKFLNDLAEATGIGKDDISAATKGILGTKENKAKWWGALEERQGSPGFVKDMEFVLEVYNRGRVRWERLTALRKRLEPVIRELREQGRPNIAEELEANLNILWGHKSAASNLLDETLASVPGLKEVVQPFTLERWTNRLKTLAAHGFLKWSPRFHLLNSLQTAQTLWPIVSTREFLRGIRLAASSEGRTILDRHGVRFLTGGKAQDLRTKGLGPVESANQQISFLTMYDKARRLGLDDAKAADYAVLRGNLYSQFLGLTTDVPRIIGRNIQTGLPAPVKSTGLLFQRFLVKNLEIGLDLVRSHDFPGAAKWLGAQALIGGTKALTHPVAGLAGTGYLTFKVYNAIKDEYGESVANVIHYGLPSLLGMDFSYSIQLINPPFGDSVPEKVGNLLLGPIGGLVTSTIDAAADTKGIEPSISKRVIGKLIQQVPALRWMESLQRIWTDDYDFRDAAGRLRFKGDMKDVLLQMGAFRSMRAASQERLIDAFMDVRTRRDEVLDQAASIRSKARVDRRQLAEEEKQEIKALLQGWNARWPEFPITGGELRERAGARKKVATTPQIERVLGHGPRRVRRLFEREAKEAANEVREALKDRDIPIEEKIRRAMGE